MKKILIAFVLIQILISFDTLSGQGSFLKQDTLNDYSSILIAKEYNGFYYLGGACNDQNIQVNNTNYIIKLDSYGNIISEYRSIDTVNQDLFHFFIINDTILRSFINYTGYSECKILIQDFDLNLNLIKTTTYHIKDTAAIGAKDVIIDEDGNYVIIGGIYNHPNFPIVNPPSSFLFKISRFLFNSRWCIYEYY